MSHDKKDTEAKQYAKEAVKRLFGNRTQEENEALERIKTLGSPENLIKQDYCDELAIALSQKIPSDTYHSPLS